jgi:hypothetical protein
MQRQKKPAFGSQASLAWKGCQTLAFVRQAFFFFIFKSYEKSAPEKH